MMLMAGLVRAGYHFIRLAIIAAMGLAGMYMLHMLAQDYNKITNRPAVSATRALLRAITKRDVSEAQQSPVSTRGGESHGQPASPVGPMGRVLRQVLMQDPLGCARKLVCQLSAAQKGPDGLRPHEVAILRLVRRSEELDNDEAAAEFHAAQDLGKSSKDPEQCAQRYNKCLIHARTVLKLLLKTVG